MATEAEQLIASASSAVEEALDSLTAVYGDHAAEAFTGREVAEALAIAKRAWLARIEELKEARK